MSLLICALVFAVAAADDYDGGYGRSYRGLGYRPSYGVGNLGYGVGNLGYGNLGGYGVPDVAYFGGNTLGNRVYGRISTPYGLNLNYGGRLGSGNLGYGLGSYGFPGYGGIGSGLGGYGFPGYGGVGYGYGRPDVAYFNGNTHGNRVYGSISTPYGLNIPYGNNIGLGFNPYGSGYGINPYGSLGGGYGVSPYLTGGYGSPALYSSYVPSRRIRRKKY